MQPDNDSLKVLNLLGEHHEFMETIKNVAVIDDTHGNDSAWWSDYRYDDEQTKSHYNIRNLVRKNQCRGQNKRSNVKFIETNMSDTRQEPGSFEIIWANNCLQRSSNPFQTLSHWWDLLKEDGMLCLSVPQTN